MWTDAISENGTDYYAGSALAVDGELHYNLSNEEFRSMLLEELGPKSDTFFASDERSESEVDENE